MSEQATESTQNESTTAVEQNEDSLPQWVRDKLTKANNEAGNYRVKAKEAAETARTEAQAEFTVQLSALSDEKAAIAVERDNAVTDLLKLRAALGVGIPGESATEFAELLQGSDADEIAAHAEKVKSMFGVLGTPKTDRPVDPSQGLGGNSSANPADAFGAFILSNLTK